MGLGQTIQSFATKYNMWGGLLNMADQRSQSESNSYKNLSRYISPVQLQRIKQDILTWRGWMTEAENPWYPHRVKMQIGYMDTKLNGHVKACIEKREKMTLLKKYQIVNKASRKPNPVTTAMIQKTWFREYMKYALQAKSHGYTLIYLDDLIKDEFPNLSIIRRANVSPDRMNVTQFVYSISGVNFTEEPFKDWHVWIPTPTDDGVSKCGYGYLYNVAFYEIVARNVLTQNLDATEQYGMPLRVGKTNKSQDDPERAVFEQALADMGSAGYMLMDAVGDEVELVESKSLGNAYKIYESLELRCEKKISKIILGHADALDSIPGKLGGGQDGEESPAQIALRETAIVDMNDVTAITNGILVPILRNLGFLIPEDEEFEFDNNESVTEARREEDEDNLQTALVFNTIKTAGGDPDWAYFSKRTGIPVTKTAPLIMPGVAEPNADAENDKPPKPAAPKPDDKIKKIKASLERLYDHKH